MIGRFLFRFFRSLRLVETLAPVFCTPRLNKLPNTSVFAPMDSAINTCDICYHETSKKERYLRNGRGKFNVQAELESLPFRVLHTSPFVCRSCHGKLTKRRSLLSQLGNLELSFEELHSIGKQSELKRSGSEECVVTPNKLRRDSPFTTPATSPTPPRDSSSILPRWCVSPIHLRPNDPRSRRVPSTSAVVHEAPPTPTPVPAIAKAEPAKVSVRVQWPSKDTERKLPDDLESLGKMLVRGTYKQIANATCKNPHIRK